MPTDDERRTVAERLRGITVDDLVSYMDDGIDSASILFSEVHGKNEVRPFLEEARYLADLIDPDCGTQETASSRVPECDRDALLRIADEMERGAKESEAYFANVGPWEVIGYARRIREACGEGER